MYNASLNDYELIYLVQEGSEIALDLLYHKYYIYINKMVGKYNIPKYKKEDLVQEGLDALFVSIKNFNPNKYDKTFYNYFKLVFERKVNRSLHSSYFSNSVVLTDVILDSVEYKSSYIIKHYRSVLKDELDIEIFEKCFLEGMSFKDLSRKTGYSYKRIYYRAKSLCEELKKY